MTRQILNGLVRLYRDEKGAEGLEKLLIVAAVVLPLLGFLIAFRSALSEWVRTKWDEVTGAGNTGDAPVVAP